MFFPLGGPKLFAHSIHRKKECRKEPKLSRRVEELFHQVVDLPEDARVRHFAELGIDAAMRMQVEALLDFDSADTNWLNNDLVRTAEAALTSFDPAKGRCGAYSLGSVIGRGRTGSVHLAER